ncbi:formate dehydrogenase accessory sulfurtransferase FdhD [Methylophaga sp.]|uniref:formate dehydrogenase accessory sulfurtransferase FdhD n=1 Tax=Methylophaga sp. TaxID=2024840 RepID=UPI00271BB452|nr:formate dehydrogenase accessory sulfurtransferase FdhD [Methylophaga sp.]MDO8826318.1 formate dehydrogenase accessory sulfurtransferase FdhD [Methylophaga sp.]
MSYVYKTSLPTPVSIYQPNLKQAHWGSDDVAVEVPVALVYNYISHVVMMATPVNLEDFAIGFSLTEEIVESREQINHVHVTQAKAGITIRLQIADDAFEKLKSKRRNMTGRTGCGLCGIESLKQAIRPIPAVHAPQVSQQVIAQAFETIRANQPINAMTGATHAAAWCSLSGNIELVREDVGRHNALDKLIGAMSSMTLDRGQGFILVTSRASYEMVQKTCMAGVGCLVAISAPTSLAIEQARQAGLLLVGFARADKHVIYHDPHQPELLSHVI